jgi:hypothetical protein
MLITVCMLGLVGLKLSNLKVYHAIVMDNKCWDVSA